MTVQRIRRIAFYVVTVLLSGLLLVGIGFFAAAELVIGWLPDDTVTALSDDLADWPPHRLHNVTMASIEVGLILGVVLQLYRPTRRVAPLMGAFAFSVTFAVVELVVGDREFSISGTAPVLVPIVLLLLLHPSGLGDFVPKGVDWVMVEITLVAAVPWLLFAISQADLAATSAPGDTHDQMQHWTRMAVLGVLVVVWGLIAATDLAGWRISGWIAAFPAVIFGLQSLVFPSQASAAPLPWAAAAVVWGVVYVGATERRAVAMRTTAVRRDRRGSGSPTRPCP